MCLNRHIGGVTAVNEQLTIEVHIIPALAAIIDFQRYPARILTLARDLGNGQDTLKNMAIHHSGQLDPRTQENHVRL